MVFENNQTQAGSLLGLSHTTAFSLVETTGAGFSLQPNQNSNTERIGLN